MTGGLTKAHIHQSNLIEGFDSEEMDEDSRFAWEHLMEANEITDDLIRKTQKIITLSQTDLQPFWRGYYRSMSGQRVWIGGREGARPDKVPLLMEMWLENFESLTPKKAHIEFETIHPFVDGNGRTGRMLMWWQEIKDGKKPTLITKKDVQSYYNWFV